jgi:hypothetical protein
LKKLPHEGVYTRLKPSRIHGVGVFAIRSIPQGTYVFPEDDEPIIWVHKRQTEEIPRVLKDLYDDFAIIKGDKFGCPRSFGLLTMSWYLNHSDEPNMVTDEDYRFHARREIKAGEELTVDYSTYSDQPKITEKRAYSPSREALEVPGFFATLRMTERAGGQAAVLPERKKRTTASPQRLRRPRS